MGVHRHGLRTLLYPNVKLLVSVIWQGKIVSVVKCKSAALSLTVRFEARRFPYRGVCKFYLRTFYIHRRLLRHQSSRSATRNDGCKEKNLMKQVNDPIEDRRDQRTGRDGDDPRHDDLFSHTPADFAEAFR